MMAEKARLFGDSEADRQILSTENPRVQKELGQGVKGFNQAMWLTERRKIVFRGNVAKFSQDSGLRQALIETGDRILVEASPRDRIWGIGLAANNPLAHEPAHWRGLNLLGEILAEVRVLLAADQRTGKRI
jgi:ribA/ribD-fused uncharacterized protein